MNKKVLFFVIAFAAVLSIAVQGQNEPVVIEAESGTLGADFAQATEGSVTYVSPQTDYNNTSYPGIADKVISFEVTFPEAGSYSLFARVRVGPSMGDDDSFYYGNGFGEKNVTNGDDWVTCNQLGSAGFVILTDAVDGQGDAPNEVWKWLALSDYVGSGDAPVTFTVEAGSLTQTFQYGARENGFDLDKIAFGKAGLYYTVANLNNGEAGSVNPPGVEPIGPPLADGLDKFLGSAFVSNMQDEFTGYWNQLTPENAGKWGSVEWNRDEMNWSGYDVAYQLAMDSNILFKHHVLVWGSQQPDWMAELDSAEQRAELVEWFNAVANRYPGIDQVEVVNEPLHAPPDQFHSGGYIDALGGAGDSGWEWILEAFRMADTTFADSVDLLINEYSVMNETENADDYLGIIKLLMAENLIDGIGLQAHGFSHGASNQTILRNLDTLASTGLPLYITELDIDGYTDRQHVQNYMNLFPLFWEHPSVKGITLWGYKPGMWRTNEMAYLIDLEGNERPAMTWLRAYLKNEFVANESVQISTVSGASEIDTDGGSLEFIAEFMPENTTLTTAHWWVSDEDIATIDENGVLTAVANGTVTVRGSSLELGSDVSDEMLVTITGQDTGVETITFNTDQITIFPNPIRDGHFTIRGMEEVKEVAVLDLNGHLIKAITTLDLNNVDVKIDVPAGMYIIRLSNGSQHYHTKIVVQ